MVVVVVVMEGGGRCGQGWKKWVYRERKRRGVVVLVMNGMGVVMM